MMCCKIISIEFLHKIDTNVSERCKRSELKLRNAGNGLWICALVPFALLSGLHYFFEWSEQYQTVSIISLGLFLSSCCGILHNDTNAPNSTNIPFIQIGYILSSTVVSLLLIFSSNRGVIYSLSFAVATSFAYHPVHQSIIKCCPKSFTWGEASLISQTLILYLSSFALNVIFSFEKSPKSCGKIATVILQTGHFAVLVTLLLAYLFPKAMSNIFVFFPILIVSFAIFVIGIPVTIFNVNALFWLFNLISDKHSLALIGFWVVCCLGAVFFLFRQTQLSNPATTASRKSFHFLIFFVFVPGLIWKPCLMYVASGIGLALLIVIEMCRKLKLSDSLQVCFDTFKDEKDEGEIALTPMYLMVGISAPIWMYPFSYSIPLPLPVLAGIFSVAIGDAAASMGGMWFGKHKWKGSNKTVEGSIFCFASQLITFLVFSIFGVIETSYIPWACVVFALTSVIEAKTDQIDNLVLPFITYTLFMIVL